MMRKILLAICLFCALSLWAGLLREATVVLAGDAGPKARFAARELAYYIGEITGKTVALVTEKENVPGFKIQVGDTGDSELDMSQCQYDGYWLKTGTDGNLLIAGRSDTGTAFGVYGFLQDVCGLRFYLPERAGTYVPRNVDLMVAEQASLNNPFFRSRYLYAPMPYDNDWFLHNRGIERYKNLHALYGIITQAHAKTHPEYFAMVDGKRLLPENGREVWRQQPCMTNPEVIALTVQYALKYFREHPDEECVSLGINDSTKFCECPECIKANDGSGNTAIGVKSYAKLAIHFYNRVAEEVCKVYPDKFIGVLAYVNINHIPEDSQYHPNIIVGIHEHPVTYFDPKSVNYEEIRQKRRGCTQLLVNTWTYGSGYLVPVFQPNLIEQFVDFCVANDIRGWTTEALTFWRLNGIKDYILLRKLWNPSLRCADILQEYARNMYAAGAAEILAFYDLAGRTWEEQDVEYPHGEHLRMGPGQFRLYSPEICRKLLSYLEKAQELSGSQAQGAVWLQRQLDYFRWLNEYQGLLADWEQKEPDELRALADYCIRLGIKCLDLTQRFQAHREPQVSRFDGALSLESIAWLLLRRCLADGNMQEWKRFADALGNPPVLTWLAQQGTVLSTGQNLIQNPSFDKFTDWQKAEWWAGARDSASFSDAAGTVTLTGLRGRRFYPPFPVVMQTIAVEEDTSYLLFCEYQCSPAGNQTCMPWISGYHMPPFCISFKPYLQWVNNQKAKNFNVVLAMSGLGEIQYRSPRLIKLPEAPPKIDVGEEILFTLREMPVLPEPLVFEAPKRSPVCPVYGRYDIQVKILASGKALSVLATESVVRWRKSLRQNERVFRTALTAEDQEYKFVYRLAGGYVSSIRFDLQPSPAGAVKRIEFIPIPPSAD